MTDNKCTHTTTELVRDWEYDDDYNRVDVWIEEEVSTDVDIDLHRYKCRKCGRIGYYSGAARAYYEDGTPHPLFDK